MTKAAQEPDRVILADPFLRKGDRVRFYNSDGSPTSEGSIRGVVEHRSISPEDELLVHVRWDDDQTVGWYETGRGSMYILGPEYWEDSVSSETLEIA